MWNQNSSCSEIHTVFFFQEGDFESGNLQVTWFFIMQNQNSSWSTTKIGFGNQREREHKFLDLKKPNGVDKTFLGLDFCFQRKKLFWDHGLLFSVDKMLWLFFLSVDKMLWAFFSTQNELLVVAQHYPHATNRPTRAQRVFSCSARVANRMRRHTDRTVTRRTAEKWKHKKILPFVTLTVVPFDRF